MAAPRERLALGLISGTSQDAVDGVLAAFDEQGRLLGLRGQASRPYPAELRSRLLALGFENQALTLAEYAACDRAVADAFAETAEAVLEAAGVRAAAVTVIGSHGQTVFHEPRRIASSLQLGDPNRLAARLGCPVVADFRRADIARGGQGAPLVCALHQALFAKAGEPRAVLNLGGIANLTLLPDADPARVRGFDTGPANGLMDEWCQRTRGQPFDRDGAWAAQGRVLPELLAAWLAEPYFTAPAPKSTGRGQFNLAWAGARAGDLERFPAADVQRSLLELTVQSVLDALRREQPDTRRLLVCGGGARNVRLMARLAEAFAGPVETTGAHGLDPAWVEATAFAWLALARLDGRSGALTGVTGARAAAVLGGLYAG